MMQLFEKYEHLYVDLRRPRPGESKINLTHHYTEREREEVWRVAYEQYPYSKCSN